MLKKPDQRYLTAHQPGQPAFLHNALKVKCTVMCIRIKFYRFGGVFQHICLTFYATFRLIRSQGGWSQALSLRQKAQKEEYDERILGSGNFVQAILKEAEEKERRKMKIRRVGLTLSRLIEEELEKSNVSLQGLKNVSRRKVVSGTRAKIARRGIEKLGLSCAKLARHLGVCTSSISRVLAKTGGEAGG
jgi:hypothetical protein